MPPPLLLRFVVREVKLPAKKEVGGHIHHITLTLTYRSNLWWLQCLHHNTVRAIKNVGLTATVNQFDIGLDSNCGEIAARILGDTSWHSNFLGLCLKYFEATEIHEWLEMALNETVEMP